ncbi:MAG: fibronectin type III domain-containing protein [Chitinophagaceae bacterium]|nr:fibronectin type III domain-containing protein [Chitinophagaceae bacterium]
MKPKIFLFSWIFLLLTYAGMSQNHTQLVTAIQYYYDTDPGLGVAGNGNVVNVTPTANYQQTMQITVPQSLGEGTHFLYVRAKDEFGRWSIAGRSLLLVEALYSTQTVVAYQYYYDTDPGVGVPGNGGVVSVPSTDSFHQNVTLNVPNNLSSGIHYLYIRFQDEFGRWSMSEKQMLFVQPGSVTSQVVAYHYYFDTDPGIGNAGNGAIVPVTPIADFNQMVQVTLPNNITPGVHNLYFRAQDEFGRWSIVDKRVVLVGSGNSVQLVNAMEYYFDNDPGIGNANPYPITPGADLNFTANIFVPCLSTGTHYLYVRALGENGAWSIIERDTISITAGVTTATVYPMGSVSVCQNDSIMLHASPVAGVSYNWLLNGSPIPGATDTFYYASQAGNYSLKSTCGSSFTTSNIVTVSVLAANTYYADADGDGYGNAAISLQACTQPSGYVFDQSDCNDTNSSIHPNAPELCNGIDEDCDGLIDEGVQTTYYADVDGDGYGNAAVDSLACSAPAGYVATAGDCNDSDNSIHPGATEICNGIDEDCNGIVDDGLLTTFYADADGDGYGNPLVDSMACSSPSGYVLDNTDCDDNEILIHTPINYYVDADQDGYGSATIVALCTLSAPIGYSTNALDCADGNGAIHPGATEICNGIDDDCDGLVDMDDPGINGAPLWYADVDGDGFGDPGSSIYACNQPTGYLSNNTDCNDADSSEHPGQVWYFDHDQDGYGAGVSVTQCLRPAQGYLPAELVSITGDCNDYDASINPVNQYFTYSGNANYTSSLISPQNGDSYTMFNFEVIYHDVNGGMPPVTFPRVILDFEGNGIYNNANDRIVIMSPDDVNDLNTTDGKKYIASVNALPIGTNWQTLIQTNTSGCATNIGPFNYPDVLIQPDVELFANDITFSSMNPSVSSPLTVSAVVHNVSDFSAQNFTVHLVNQYDTTIVYGDITIPNLAAHTNTTVNWNITTPNVPAWCPMQVTIDYSNVITESNELDNTAIRPFINGNYNLPGSILTTANVTPSVAYAYPGQYNTLYGDAHYTGTTVPLPDSSVAGATVDFTILETGATYSTYTNSGGVYSYSFPRPMIPGIYHIQGSITDFTLTGTFIAEFEVVTPPTPPCLPDLHASLILSATNIVEGTTITGTLTVHNFGCASSPATTMSVAQVGGIPLLATTVNIPALNSGASYSLPISLTYANSGQYSLCISVDGSNDIIESDETNNSQCAVITVIPNISDIVPGAGPSGTQYECQANGIGFTVHNLGGAATGPFDCLVDVLLNGNYQYSMTHTISNIPSVLNYGGNYVYFSLPFIPSSTGNYTFQLHCDLPANAVLESNELNNEGGYALNIIPCMPNFSLSGCEYFDVESADWNYTAGDSITLQGRIVNSGNQSYAGALEVQYALSGGAVYNTTEIVNLPPGASINISKNVIAPPVATESLTIQIDPNNLIAEMVESDNSITNNMCWDFEPTPYCGGNFWGLTYLVNQSIYLSIGVNASNLYNADTVKVKFEVSGPGLSGTIDLGYGSMYDVYQTCGCPSGATLPVSFAFPQEGDYTFTMTVDPFNEYTECNEGNNVIVRVVHVTNLPDMRILSQHINPSMLNPQPGQNITMDITYENIGTSNINDQMRLSVLMDNVPFATVYPVGGLVNGGNTTINIPTPYSSALPGVHVIRAIIDADSQIQESNEMNNEATRSFIVGQTANLYFQELTATNLVPAVNDMINIQSRIGNDGDIACEADVQLFYVDNNLDSILIGTTHVSLSPHDSVSLIQPWMVLDNKTNIVGRIINSSILEATYTDNESNFALGAMVVSMASVPSCTGGNNGTLTANVLGGDPPYNYLWSNSYMGQTLTAGVGTYTVTVTDNSGQTISATGTITQSLIQTTFSVTACDSFLLPWSAVPVTVSGSYDHTYTTGGGCDSLVTANVVINQSTSNVSNVTACDTYTWPVNGATYTAGGVYSVVSTNPSGCLHTEILNLTLNYGSLTTQSVTTCGSYFWSLDGQTYNTTGNYTYVTTNLNGCQDTTVLQLVITGPNLNNTTNITSCDSFTWSVNNVTYYAGGSYTYVSGCTTEVLNLTLNNSTINTYAASACGSYFWPVNGQAYTTSGTYTFNNGCTTEVLNLTITPVSTNTTNVSVCGFYVWPVNGQTYTATGTYTYSPSACTTEILNLIVATAPAVTGITVSNVTGNSATICWDAIGGIGWYEVRWRPIGSPVWSFGTNAAAFNCKTLPLLLNATNYEVQVRAICNLTTSAGLWSSSSTFTTLNTCGAPVGLSASGISYTSATMIWNPDPGAMWYSIRYRVASPIGPWLTGTSSVTNKMITGLIPGTVYDVQVSAACSGGQTPWSAVTSFSTLSGCGAPTGLNAINLTSTKATLVWNAVSGAGWYNVRYRATGAPTWINTTSTPNNKNIVGLLPGTQYEFQVATVCGSSSSSFSPSSLFTTASAKSEVETEIQSNVEQMVRLYPNPAHSDLYIDLYSATVSNATIKVLDMSGRIIKQVQIQTTEGLNHLTISMKDILDGIYTVQVYQDQKQIFMSKVLKY